MAFEVSDRPTTTMQSRGRRISELSIYETDIQLSIRPKPPVPVINLKKGFFNVSCMEITKGGLDWKTRRSSVDTCKRKEIFIT